jgi:hypothetical protein
MTKQNTEGRKSNAAQPLGERKGTASQSQTKATGKAERETAGPDGPDAKAVSRTFKRR